jgi:hypothetical protein
MNFRFAIGDSVRTAKRFSTSESGVVEEIRIDNKGVIYWVRFKDGVGRSYTPAELIECQQDPPYIFSCVIDQATLGPNFHCIETEGNQVSLRATVVIKNCNDIREAKRWLNDVLKKAGS